MIMANEKNGITEPENKTTNQAIVIPLLEPEDIDVKIKQVKDTGALALLYKTARTDMDILDRVFGAMNWMDSYQEIKGNLYCTISIWDAHKQMWIAKQDCGIESREEIINRLNPIGLSIDKEVNNTIAGYRDKQEGKISDKNSKVDIYVVPTNEELMIIKDTYKIVNEK